MYYFINEEQPSKWYWRNVFLDDLWPPHSPLFIYKSNLLWGFLFSLRKKKIQWKCCCQSKRNKWIEREREKNKLCIMWDTRILLAIPFKGNFMKTMECRKFTMGAFVHFLFDLFVSSEKVIKNWSFKYIIWPKWKNFSALDFMSSSSEIKNIRWSKDKRSTDKTFCEFELNVYGSCRGQMKSVAIHLKKKESKIQHWLIIFCYTVWYSWSRFLKQNNKFLFY